MFVKISLILLCSVGIWSRASSQVIESNANREKIFAFEVKHIDEFMERFNNEQRSLIISYVKINYPGITVDKNSLVTNLFNRQEKNWNKPDVDSFINQVITTEPPVYLDFYSNDWYAEALCRFMYNGKPVDVTILLKIRQELNGGSKWVIESANSKFIAPAKSVMAAMAPSVDMKFLHPMSHATNFMSLSVALRDKAHIRDYLDSGFMEYPTSKAFLQALQKNQLEYQFVKKITYHFLQIDGWIFTVNKFTRRSVNSGWLISGLWKASEKDKDDYKNLLLYKDYEKKL